VRTRTFHFRLESSLLHFAQVAIYCILNERFRLGSVQPAQDLHPFSLFEFFVMLEEVRNLFREYGRQIRIVADVGIERMKIVYRHCEHFLIHGRLFLISSAPTARQRMTAPGTTATLLTTRMSQGSATLSPNNREPRDGKKIRFVHGVARVPARTLPARNLAAHT
jgi:hypothetical protein